MKISFLGLSAFMIEDITRRTIILDPFDDRPEFQLGVHLPTNLKADFVYFSHKDPDHYNPSFISQSSEKTGNFLRRSVTGNEFNGDEFKINILEVDGLTIAHFADQSVPLIEDQLSAIGKIDIAIYSPPKADGKLLPEALEVSKLNLEKINPKVIIWSHFITPAGWEDQKTSHELRELFKDYLGKTANTNMNYKSRESFIELCYILENALELNKYFNGKIIDGNSIEIDDLPSGITSILFADMN